MKPMAIETKSYQWDNTYMKSNHTWNASYKIQLTIAINLTFSEDNGEKRVRH